MLSLAWLDDELNYEDNKLALKAALCKLTLKRIKFKRDLLKS